jgi:hypothetical protein
MAGAAGGFAGGVTGALLSGANLGQAFTAGIVGGLIGAASGFLNFASAGAYYTPDGRFVNDIPLLEKAARHAFSDAWLNGITGGDIKHGFITGSLSTLGNDFIDNNFGSKISDNGKISNNLIPKVACAAALGGTIEEIGGGKFANGAITGAYGMLFNELMHENEEGVPPGKNNAPPQKSSPLFTLSFNRGIPQFETTFTDEDWGAFTPGPFIVYPKGGSMNKYYNTHEPGHVIQFLILGPAGYYSLIVLPSLFTSTTPYHSNMPWEKTANQLWYWLTGEHDPSNPLYFGPKKK